MKRRLNWRSATKISRHPPLLASAASTESCGAADCRQPPGIPRSTAIRLPNTGPARHTSAAPGENELPNLTATGTLGTDGCQQCTSKHRAGSSLAITKRARPVHLSIDARTVD
eukprot:281044-Pyramimonas_sp.AAC.1